MLESRPMDKDHIVETWQINNRVDLYLLDAIAEEHLADTFASKGRDVAKQFAHIHNVRLMWLKVAAPEINATQMKIDTDAAIDKKVLQKRLTESGEAIAELLSNAVDNGGKVKGFKPHVTAFLGYLLAHDAHHRSQVILALKQSGHKIDQKIGYGIWEWGSR
jgi:uncharacterized damage-inducible protein DinB